MTSLEVKVAQIPKVAVALGLTQVQDPEASQVGPVVEVALTTQIRAQRAVAVPVLIVITPTRRKTKRINSN